MNSVNSSTHGKSGSSMVGDAEGSESKPSDTSSSSNSMSSFKLLLLVMMVLQNSSTVLVGRYTRAGIPEQDLYDVNHLVLVIEVAKLVLSMGLEFYATSGNLMQSLDQHIFQQPYDALKILVPAILYLIQNTLLYVALSNLTAPIFQVTYQAKLVTTAIVSVFMLQRKYSVQQWICLSVLSVGVAIVVLGEKKGGGGGRRLAEVSTSQVATQSLSLGLTAVTIACFSSALAGVYFEKVLKKPTADATKQAQPSLWMRNIQLSFFSVVIALVQGWFKDSKYPEHSYLHGFGFWAWVLVFLQAGGGLLVAAVIKYADNVLKGLATGVSVVFATVLSILFFGTQMTGQFTLGASLILGSVYLFSNPIPVMRNEKKTEDAVELKGLLPK
jgi:UDP-galactose transporter